MTLAGLTTPNSGSYNISLDSGPPETYSALSSFNLSSPTVLFFRTGLDPAVVHQLDIVNAGAAADGVLIVVIIGVGVLARAAVIAGPPVRLQEVLVAPASAVADADVALLPLRAERLYDHGRSLL